MHSKLIVIDGRYSIVGSANFDPRSFRQNGEIAVVLESRGLAEWITGWIDGQIHTVAHAVRLNLAGQEEWIATRNDVSVRQRGERLGSGTRAAKALIFTLLPFDQHL